MRYIILICCLILTACSTHKKIQYSSEKELSVNNKLDVGQISSSNAAYLSSTMIWDSAWHNAIINFRIYDTSQPDSSGYCPLLAEGEVNINSGKLKNVQNIGAAVVTKKDSVDAHSEAEIKEQSKEKEIVKKDRSICQPYQWWVLGILAFLNGALILFLKHKTKNIQEE